MGLTGLHSGLAGGGPLRSLWGGVGPLHSLWGGLSPPQPLGGSVPPQPLGESFPSGFAVPRGHLLPWLAAPRLPPSRDLGPPTSFSRCSLSGSSFRFPLPRLTITLDSRG